MTRGPNCGSRTTPTISSATPWTIACTVTPWIAISGTPLMDPLQEGGERRPQLGGRLNAQRHPADIRLMGDPARGELQGDRVAHGFGQRQRRLYIGRQPATRRGDAIRRQQRRDLLRRQPLRRRGRGIGRPRLAWRCGAAPHDRPRRGGIYIRRALRRGQGSEIGEPLFAPPHGRQRAAHPLRERIIRDAAAVQDLGGFAGRGQAHDHAQNRLLAAQGTARDLAHHLGQAHRLEPVLRRLNDDHCVHRFVGQKRVEAEGIRGRACPRQHVHRVFDAGRRKHTLPQKGFGSLVSGARLRPFSSSASAARMAGPPALVRMATRLPWGRGCHASARPQSNNSSIVVAPSTPARRKAACRRPGRRPARPCGC